MAYTVPRTLLELRTEVLQHANMENSQFVTTAEVNRRINQNLAALYRRLASNGYLNMYLEKASVVILVGQDTYALPADFYQLGHVSVKIAEREVALKSATWNEWSLTRSANFRTSTPVVRLVKTSLVFSPAPTQNHTGTIWYVPRPPVLDSDSATFDGIAGWEDYAIFKTVAELMAKEESDTAPWNKMAQEALGAIETELGSRTQVLAGRVQDCTQRGDLAWWDNYAWTGQW